MDTYRDRAYAERTELKDRLHKLDKFIGNPDLVKVFQALPVEDQVLLKLQSCYMRLYLGALQERIDRFEEHIAV